MITDESELNQFIFEKYYQTKDIGSQIDKRFIRHFTRRAKIHIKYLTKFYNEGFKGKVLDVGCGAGLFLNEMRKIGWDTNGIEPSRECYKYATNNLKLDVYRGLFQEYKSDKKFDLIYFSHIFDDIPDIVGVLSKINNLLNDDGKIFIEVPNLNRDKNFKSVKDGDFIENRYYFTPSTLRHLLENNGFKIEELITYEAIYLNTLFQYFKSPFLLLKRMILPRKYKAHIRLIATRV